MALCMQSVFKGKAQHNTMNLDLWTLAGRIARNREIAGLHYPSDTAAGVAIARSIKDKLDDSPAASLYKKTLKAARGGMAMNYPRHQPRPDEVDKHFERTLKLLERGFTAFPVPSPGEAERISLSTPRERPG